MDDLFPLALVSPFLFLPPPLRNLVFGLLALLVVSIVLRAWLGHRGAGR